MQRAAQYGALLRLRERTTNLLTDPTNLANPTGLGRCMIRDVAVKVPEPEDFIAEYIFPTHIIVPRCSGRPNMHFIFL